MTEQIEISINFERIPDDVGVVFDGLYGPRMQIYSMKRLKTWVINQSSKHPSDNQTIIVQGPMSNCIALHVGAWLKDAGTLMYQSSTGFRRELV